MAADDVQIDINELMGAFAKENAALLQRAIIAEQKVRAYRLALLEARVDSRNAVSDATPEDPERVP